MKRFFLIGAWVLVMSGSLMAASAQMAANFLQDMFLSGGESKGISPNLFNWAQVVRDFEALDFYTDGRVGFDLSVATVSFDLGGPGSGSLLMDFPPARPVTIDSAHLSPEQNAMVRAFSRIGLGYAGRLSGDATGSTMVDFLSEDGGSAAERSNIVEKLLRFKVTPGMVFGIKLCLLLKHMAQHSGFRSKAEDANVSYAADAAILLFRLMRTWRRDSRAIGGFSATLAEKAPWIAKAMKQISVAVTPDKDELWLHRKLDALWKLMVDGGGILFAADGSVSRGLGFSVTALSCHNESDAQALAAFLSQKQINWTKLDTEDMPDKPFIAKVMTLLDLYGSQIGRLQGPEFAQKQEEFSKLKRIVSDVIMRRAQEDLGRFDLDLTNNENVDPRLKSKSFLSLVTGDGPLSHYKLLPQVVSADNTVYYCSNQIGGDDLVRLLLVIVFQAAWRYVDIMHGNSEFGTEMTAKIRETDRAQSSAASYVTGSEGSYVQVPLQLLFNRPTIDVVALLSRVKAKSEKAPAADVGAAPSGDATEQDLAQQLLEAIRKNQIAAINRVIELYKELETVKIGATSVLNVTNEIKKIEKEQLKEAGVGEQGKAQINVETFRNQSAVGNGGGNFKQRKINEVCDNITALERLCAEKDRALQKESTMENLSAWVKVRSALDGERALLAIINSLPVDESALAKEVVAYGKKQAEETRKKLEVDVAQKNCPKTASTWDTSSVRLALDAYDKARRTKKDATDLLKEARDSLAVFYEMEAGCFDELLLMIDGLWQISAGDFEKQKASDDDKNRAARQLASIWQSGATEPVIGKRELVEQRRDDWEHAEKALKAARKGGDDFKKEQDLATKMREAYKKDQGRFDFETVIRTARDTLRETVRRIRMIDEKTPQKTELSRDGLSVLHREVLFFGKGGTSMLGDGRGSGVRRSAMGWIASFASVAKEMKPLRDEVGRRLEQVRRLFPGMEFSIAFARAVIERQMPGLLTLDLA